MSLQTSVVITEGHNLMANSKQINRYCRISDVISEVSLKWFCCIRVRQYIKCLKLQTNEEYSVKYWSTSQTYSQNDRKIVWRFGLRRYSTLEHTKYLIWTLKLNWKKMIIKIFFIVVLFLAVMTLSDMSEECIFSSYTVLLNIV